jgi:hypothetical protein
MYKKSKMAAAAGLSIMLTVAGLVAAAPASAATANFGPWGCSAQWVVSNISGTGQHGHLHVQGSSQRSTTFPTAGVGISHSSSWGPAWHSVSSSSLTATTYSLVTVGCAG